MNDVLINAITPPPGCCDPEADLLTGRDNSEPPKDAQEEWIRNLWEDALDGHIPAARELLAHYQAAAMPELPWLHASDIDDASDASDEAATNSVSAGAPGNGG